VALLYERGRFGAADTARAAALLRVFAFAVPAWVTQQIAVRGFFARGDTWRPMLLATAVALAAAPLYAALGPRFGAQGLAAAGVLGMSANAILTLWLLRRVHDGPALRVLGATLVRAVFVAAIGGLAAGWVATRVESTPGQLLAGGAVFAIVSIPGAYAIGDEATRELLRRLLGRLRRRSRA
jgi:putative peptidoglycan lipid II flippase